MPSLPRCPRISLSFGLFGSLSSRFCHRSGAGVLLCTAFAYPIRGERFNILVAQSVGMGMGGSIGFV
jgi:hypothetical protein